MGKQILPSSTATPERPPHPSSFAPLGRCCRCQSPSPPRSVSAASEDSFTPSGCGGQLLPRQRRRVAAGVAARAASAGAVEGREAAGEDAERKVGGRSRSKTKPFGGGEHVVS